MTVATTLRARIHKDRPEPVSRSIERKDASGAVLGTVELDPEIFGIEPNVSVLHQVITAQLASRRAGTQSTKTRAEVRGGGRKPFRQKGTGNARQGSSRSPNQKGGGVAFGPKPRSYVQKTPKKMVRLALRSALSDRASTSKVALVDRFGITEPRTRDAAGVLDALGIDGTVLVVVSADDAVTTRSLRNLARASTILSGELNAHDVLANDWVLFTDETLPTSASDAHAAGPAGTAADATEGDEG